LASTIASEAGFIRTVLQAASSHALASAYGGHRPSLDG
jgi:hypothetical protein